MNPQFPGQYAQNPRPPSSYGGPPNAGQPTRPQGPPDGAMYNGQHMQGGGQYGQQPGQKPPMMSNGPQPGGPGQPAGYGAPQGFAATGGRPPGPNSVPNKPGPSQMGPGPGIGPNGQMSNQLGNMSISDQYRGPAPSQNNVPGGYGPPQPGKGPSGAMQPGPPSGMQQGPPSGMQQPGPPGSMPGAPHPGPPSGMQTGPPGAMPGGPPHPGVSQAQGGGPPHAAGGPPHAPVGGSHAPGGPPQHGYGPPHGQTPATSGYGAPTTGSYNQPPTSGFGQQPPTSGFGQQPPTNSYNQPPTSGYGPQPGQPPVSGYGPPPGGQGNQANQPPGFPPIPSTGQSNQGMPPGGGGMRPGVPPTSYGQPTGNYQPPPSMGMDRQTPTSFAGGPPGNMPPHSQPGYGPPGQGFPPGGAPPTSQAQHPGMPPQGQYGGGAAPGYHGAQPGTGAPGMQPPGMQQPAQKRLDPDQMPSPIQVIEDDKRNRSGIFSTAGKGSVPPLVSTQFTTQDQGNCNPSFMRSTMYHVPCTSDMLKNSHIPFALTISPFAKLQDQEGPPPIVNLGEIGPVRCKRCKAYMNPYMMFIDGGKRFQCVFCGAATDVPSEYFKHLDHTGRRVDSYERPELCLGSYEFVATKDYCKNSVVPNEPAFIFMIDVSYNAVKSGLVQLICERLKNDILVNLPRDMGADESEIRVGFVTYNKEIHFYNVKGNLAQPQMLVVSDLEDVFVPLLDGFLVKLSESEAVIDSLLQQIPSMFCESRETEVVLGPVIQAGLDALKSADRAGKLYIFHTSLPIGEAPGKLKNRDDRKLLGTDKEKTILSAQNKFYSQLGQECVSAGCSVDLFLFPNAYCDVATMSDICRLTSGNLYKYSYFQADLDGERFMEDLKSNVQSQQAFDAIVRVRTSQGIRPVDFLGNFYMANTTDVEMCSIDSNQALSVEIKHDDKLSEQDGAYVQVAVLFTSVSGQRRLRIHNQSLNVCSQLADLFRNCELDTLVNYMSKHAIRSILNKSPRETREHIMTQVANILACYRKNCASPSSAGQLILPECMKLLPLYGNCIVKCDGIQGGQEISTDDRSYLMHLTNSMDIKTSSAFFYPRLIPLHNLDPDTADLPTAMRCSSERLQDNGVYLLENGISMFMWIGHNVNPEWIQSVFSVQSAAQIDIDKCRLLDLENETSHRVREAVQQVRAYRNRYMKLTIVRQRDKLEPWFNHFLVEDKGSNGSASYVDFLCHIHKEIRTLLS